MLCAFARTPVMMSGHDKIAKKYCFRGTCRVLDASTGTPVGIFTAFDANVDVAKGVRRACDMFVDRVDAELVCEDPELVMYQECPVELTDDIYYASIVEVDLD